MKSNTFVISLKVGNIILENVRNSNVSRKNLFYGSLLVAFFSKSLHESDQCSLINYAFSLTVQWSKVETSCSHWMTKRSSLCAVVEQDLSCRSKHRHSETCTCFNDCSSSLRRAPMHVNISATTCNPREIQDRYKGELQSHCAFELRVHNSWARSRIVNRFHVIRLLRENRFRGFRCFEAQKMNIISN